MSCSRYNWEHANNTTGHEIVMIDVTIVEETAVDYGETPEAIQLAGVKDVAATVRVLLESLSVTDEMIMEVIKNVILLKPELREILFETRVPSGLGELLGTGYEVGDRVAWGSYLESSD